MEEHEGSTKRLTVCSEDRGQRLDAWLCARCPEEGLSRAVWQRAIAEGRVLVEGVTRKAGMRLAGGETVTITSLPATEDAVPRPEAIPLSILYEDEDLIAIDKPPGMVVHPAPGHAHGTVVAALLHHCGRLAPADEPYRPGIVHRLDKDTSGVLVVAKTETARDALKEQFKTRAIRKTYQALVWGRPTLPAGEIATLIGRHALHRKKMSARPPRGKEALTRYKALEALGPATLMEVRIETGRTHQIRVHLAHIRHPVIGDRQYGLSHPPSLPVKPRRQMLHACSLVLQHPSSGRELRLEAPRPADMETLVRALRGLGSGPTVS